MDRQNHDKSSVSTSMEIYFRQSICAYILAVMIFQNFVGSVQGRQFYRGTDFRKMLEFKTPFVDKSLFIKEVLEDPTKTILIARPHGFGKSTNLSMMKAFLMTNSTSRLLFQNSEISKDVEFCKREQNKNPVIHVSFGAVRGITFDECKKKLTMIMNNLYLEHMYLGTSDRLSEEEKRDFVESYTGAASNFQALLLVTKLMKLMHKHYNQKVILLMEDYDALILSAQLYHFNEEMMTFTKGVMENIFKDDSLRKGVIAGIFTERENMFMGFKNLAIYTVFHQKYAEYFGFTAVEVLNLKIDYNIKSPNAIPAMKDYYEGYKIGNSILMNPWSVVHFFMYGARLGNYWMKDLGGCALLNGTVKDGVMTQIMADMIFSGVEILMEQDLLTLNVRSPHDIYWIYLLQFGFFTVDHQEKTDDGKILCQLKLANKEIRSTIQESLNLHLKQKPAELGGTVEPPV